MKSFSIIAAMDQRRGIGKDGSIPWRLKGDMDYFRDVTVGQVRPPKQNAVIMGHATWYSLPERAQPLPKRLNVVLSRHEQQLSDGVLLFNNFHTALQSVSDDPQVQDIFVIGGGSLYAQTIGLPECQTIYLTEIDQDFNCDVFFPEIPSGFEKVDESKPKEENGISYRFLTYKRK